MAAGFRRVYKVRSSRRSVARPIAATIAPCKHRATSRVDCQEPQSSVKRHARIECAAIILNLLYAFHTLAELS